MRRMSLSLVIRMARRCKADLTGPGRKGSHALMHIRSRPLTGSRKDFMQSTIGRWLIGAAMMVLALIFTGILAMALEKHAEDRQHVDEPYTPPKEPRF